MELDEVRSVEDCTKIATVDAHDEEEQASGWLSCFEDVFSNVGKVKVAGETVTLKGFDLQGDAVLVGVCERNKKKLKVTLDSIELIEPTRAQKLWLKACVRWQG